MVMFLFRAVPPVADLFHEVVLQVGQQQEPSVHEYSPSLKPWDALSVSSFAHTSCAQSADGLSAVVSGTAQSFPRACFALGDSFDEGHL